MIDVYEVVCKLIGPISPVGETHTDDRRFDNLKKLTELVHLLVIDIDRVATNNENKTEFSMKRAGDWSSKFLSDSLGIEE